MNIDNPRIDIKLQDNKTKNNHNAKSNTLNYQNVNTDKNNSLIKKKKHSTKVKTLYNLYSENVISHHGYTGFVSVAARHTALERDAIQFDCGFMPQEIGMYKLLILITHFHSDHGRDVCNFIGNDQRVTIFVPSYCAEQLFIKIKSDMYMQKGREYTDQEIVKMVRIIGCKRDNGEIEDQINILSNQTPDLVIAEFINMGDKIKVHLRGREEVMVEPFSCYHTVDTCGYTIFEVRKKLSDCIEIEKNSIIEVNFTEDQIIYKNKNKKNDKNENNKNNKNNENNEKNKNNKINEKNEYNVKNENNDKILNDINHVSPIEKVYSNTNTITNTNTNTNTNINTKREEITCSDFTREIITNNDLTNVDTINMNEEESINTIISEPNDDTSIYFWERDSKYKDIVEFSNRHGIKIQADIVDKQMTERFTLKIRRLRFPDGMCIKTKDETGKCTLIPNDFIFFKKYKIDAQMDQLTAKTMFFGDTCSYVFDKKHTRIHELLGMVEHVIIESTYLENYDEMNQIKYKERLKKRHMFLFELFPIIEKNSSTEFLLIHFSACYDKESIKNYVDRAKNMYQNITAFI